MGFCYPGELSSTVEKWKLELFEKIIILLIIFEWIIPNQSFNWCKSEENSDNSQECYVTSLSSLFFQINSVYNLIIVNLQWYEF